MITTKKEFACEHILKLMPSLLVDSLVLNDWNIGIIDYKQQVASKRNQILTGIVTKIFEEP